MTKTEPAAPLNPITVMIVEDRGRIRETIVDIINGSEGIKCIGAYSSCEAVLDALKTMVADVLLMDIGLP